MKVFIMSISAGGGHMRAANALKAHILLDDPNSNVMIIDTLKYINPMLDKLIIGSYLKSLKIYPSAFGALYNHAERGDGLSSVSSRFNELMGVRLLPLINAFDPDIIVSTHPFCNDMISTLKLRGLIACPTISIMTDFAPHSFWLHPGIDKYIVSNMDMKQEMVLRGIPNDIIYDFGIPVSPDFLQYHDKKETLTSLNLDSEKFTILLMGGSLGIGNILEVYNLLQELPLDFQIIIICGSNEKLSSTLSIEAETSSKATKVIGYTKNVNMYMQCADLLLTKPGGLTISEALICNTPIGIFSPLPGQEEKNAEFLLRHNLAIDLLNGNDCKQTLCYTLSHPNVLLNIKEKSKFFSRPLAGRNILHLLTKLYNHSPKKASYLEN